MNSANEGFNLRERDRLRAFLRLCFKLNYFSLIVLFLELIFSQRGPSRRKQTNHRPPAAMKQLLSRALPPDRSRRNITTKLTQVVLEIEADKGHIASIEDWGAKSVSLRRSTYPLTHAVPFSKPFFRQAPVNKVQ